MKTVFLSLLLTSILLCPTNSQAQKGDGAAAAAGALLGIGAGIAAVKQMEERAELTATQWLLNNEPQIKNFSLKTLSFDGKKMKDISGTSVITYKIQEFIPSEDIQIDGRKQVLFGFTSPGWLNDFGIDFEKVKWMLIDEDEWMNMMTAYVSVASGETDKGTLQSTLRDGKVVNKGVKIGNKTVIPFYKLSGDMYVVTDYSQDLKLLYNERSLGIYLKDLSSLVQIGRGDIIDIHDFFFDE